MALVALTSLGAVSAANPSFLLAAPGEYLVSWDEDAVAAWQIEDAVLACGATLVETSRTGGSFALVRVPEGKDGLATVNALAERGEFTVVEPNYYRFASYTPNDPYLSYQWHFGNINAYNAWNVTNGAGSVVAVIDTGVSLAGTDGIGQYVAGYDFVDNDTNPTDLNGHGTHVAGTICQSTNNSKGVAGLAYGATVMGVRVLDANGSGSVYDVADGIRYAADNGAHVINMSLGSSTGSSIEESAINYAAAAGVVICSAAGNSGSLSGVEYPARYAACIAVGATRYDNARVSYSTGGTGLDVMAPGGDTSVDQNGDGYVDGVLQETFSGTSWGYYFFQGTSMATPHVAAVAALVRSAHPTWTSTQIRAAIENTVTDLGAAGWDNYYGWGLVNAYAAVNYGGTAPTATPVPATPTPTVAPPTATPTPSTGCTVTILSATYASRKLTVTANCSERSTLYLYANGTYIGTMSYSTKTRTYSKSVRLTWTPTYVEVTSACGGYAYRAL